MRKYEGERIDILFSQELHSKLKEVIFGKVFVKIEGDELRVNIESIDFKYDFAIDDIFMRILKGLTTEYLVYEIVNDFKSQLLKTYMKRHFVTKKVVSPV